ncbi:MAG: hypothetical protein WAS23_07480 [Dokdonella sp.]|uniref:hypothetical protein n=2 Tax=Dokdonella sp. TaxID=2291710 RepID=UPI002BF89C8E|nr:hypothetical protein [Dokdonella sp.]HOX72661.1 hypothetical protein [Dokdonella sp.]HPG95095.1 hypothetical protein [Dokdonella sp.]
MQYRSKKRRPGLAIGAIWLVLCVLLPAGVTTAQSSGGSYTLRKHVIGAGVTAQGSPYRITATAGQSTAGVVTGGSYSLKAGFHRSSPTGLPDLIFCNGFETAACNSTSTSGAPQ